MYIRCIYVCVGGLLLLDGRSTSDRRPASARAARWDEAPHPIQQCACGQECDAHERKQLLSWMAARSLARLHIPCMQQKMRSRICSVPGESMQTCTPCLQGSARRRSVKKCMHKAMEREARLTLGRCGGSKRRQSNEQEQRPHAGAAPCGRPHRWVGPHAVTHGSPLPCVLFTTRRRPVVERARWGRCVCV